MLTVLKTQKAASAMERVVGASTPRAPYSHAGGKRPKVSFGTRGGLPAFAAPCRTVLASALRDAWRL